LFSSKDNIYSSYARIPDVALNISQRLHNRLYCPSQEGLLA